MWTEAMLRAVYEKVCSDPHIINIAVRDALGSIAAITTAYEQLGKSRLEISRAIDWQIQLCLASAENRASNV